MFISGRRGISQKLGYTPYQIKGKNSEKFSEVNVFVLKRKNVLVRLMNYHMSPFVATGAPNMGFKARVILRHQSFSCEARPHTI